MATIAWDIETAPLPLSGFSERQMRRYEMLWRKDEPGASEPSEETSRRVRSLHPMLGFICCISIARLDADGEPRQPVSFEAASPEAEPVMLQAFWAAIQAAPGRSTWVTFNGKSFDCDWLRVRSARHDIVPSRRDILDTYPFNHRPHADLAKVFSCRAGLADLCDLLGVPNPKSEMDGSGVAVAVEAGRIADIARYCEADVVATLRCFTRLAGQL